MTQAEWLASEDPQAMLRWLSERPGRDRYAGASDRKLRLFACAVWRTDRNNDEWALRELAKAERLADGKGRHASSAHTALSERAVDAALAAAEHGPCPTERGQASPAQIAALLRDIVGNPRRPVTLPNCPACVVCGGTGSFLVGAGEDAERMACRRCPWLTPQVLTLARAAYEDRLPDGTLDPLTLAVLTDAMEEAGCQAESLCGRCNGKGYWHRDGDPDDTRDGGGPMDCDDCQMTGNLPHPLLAHLRSPGPHARGCWALDLILGKE